MRLLRRLDVIVLALMLVRVIVIVGRDAFRYQLIRRFPETDTNSQAFQRRRKMFAAELKLRLYTLRSIAYTAPFLGLAGSCVGIFDSFTGVGMERRTALALITSNLARSPITVAMALFVTVPAIWSYNYLRTRSDLLQIDTSGSAFGAIRERKRRCIGVAQSLPLTKQFSGLPSSAVTVAPCLALVIAGFITLSSFDISMGLPVGLLETEDQLARGEYLEVDPIVVVVVEDRDRSLGLYVNSKKTPLDRFDAAMQSALELRPKRVAYVEAQSNVQWKDVVNVINMVERQTTVVLSTITPDIKSSPR